MNRYRLLIASFMMLPIIMTATISFAASPNEQEGGNNGATGLALPRFAALRSGEVNMRKGPGTRYPIEWQFTHKGLPVEITAEYEIWRKVRDPEGAEGWVHKSALSGKRAAIITGSQSHPLRETESDTAPAVAHLDSGVVGQLLSCGKEWCKLKFGDIKGYLRKTDFWGAYPNETFR